MNMMFPEYRNAMQGSITCLCTALPLSSAALLSLTLIQEQPGQGVTEQTQSFTSLPFSSNKTQPHPNIWDGGRNCPQPQPCYTPAQVVHGRRMLP